MTARRYCTLTLARDHVLERCSYPSAGLTAFRLDGKRAFSVFPEKDVGIVWRAGRYAYVRLNYENDEFAAINLDAGRVVATASLPDVVLAPAPD